MADIIYSIEDGVAQVISILDEPSIISVETVPVPITIFEIEAGPQGTPGLSGGSGNFWKILSNEIVSIPDRYELSINNGTFDCAGTLRLGAESILLVRA